MNGMNNFDKTYREYSLAPIDDWRRFWRSAVKGQVTGGSRGGEGIDFDSSTSIV